MLESVSGTNGLPGSGGILPVAIGIGGLMMALLVMMLTRGERRRATKRAFELLAAERAARVEITHLEAILQAEDELNILYRPGHVRAYGRLPEGYGAPQPGEEALEFDRWLTTASVEALEARLEEIRPGHSVRVEAITRTGAHLAVLGALLGDDRCLRFRPIPTPAPPPAATAGTGPLAALFGLLPHPVWLRDGGGRLVWVNAAYAQAVEAAAPADAVEAGIDLIDSDGRKELAEALTRGAVARQRLAVVSAGQRRILDVVEAAAAGGSGGIGVDVTELERTEATLKRTVDWHARTLDQLATAVAIFGPDRRLAFYNAAYQALWGLETGRLEARPTDGDILDALRAARKLPEQTNFRDWKESLMTAYQSLEPREHWWHLPDGQTLRVVVNPHPQGGVTYVYENVTERLDLESRYNALMRVQGETLDHLSEGVAVFGSDGRLRLWNPAFSAIWDVDDDRLAAHPHVSSLGIRAAAGVETAAWREIAAAVTGLVDSRNRLAGRIERAGDTVLDYATVPLPDGATLATFVDVTDTVRVERALVDRNEALVAADRLKDAFIQHVSYELRTPLNTVIGFTDLLTRPATGPLNEKQREYADYITSATKELLAIIDDILDLASIDAGVMDLELGPVDVAATVDAAIEGVQDRLRERRLTLELVIAPDIGGFTGDAKRIRQVLFNLLSNAVLYSEPGGRIEVSCRDEHGAVAIAVADEGRGIPADRVGLVFDRFVAGSDPGGERRGAGLGLSIVKSLVELHGGSVAIRSQEGAGTTVVCRFPRRPVPPARRKATP